MSLLCNPGVEAVDTTCYNELRKRSILGAGSNFRSPIHRQLAENALLHCKDTWPFISPIRCVRYLLAGLSIDVIKARSEDRINYAFAEQLKRVATTHNYKDT